MVLLEPIEESEKRGMIRHDAELGGASGRIDNALEAADAVTGLIKQAADASREKRAVAVKPGNIRGQASQLGPRHLHDLYFEQHLLNAAYLDVVDDLGRVVGGELHDGADVVG